MCPARGAKHFGILETSCQHLLVFFTENKTDDTDVVAIKSKGMNHSCDLPYMIQYVDYPGQI